ncbi:MAG: carotenoid oxygenase family protein [Myxococcota bacterium]|nr:carotenoid oxygenase family protein [Myxococcota bacterium]
MKLDRRSGRLDVWDAGVGMQPDEAIFVPAPGASGEDEGYVLSMVFDASVARSQVVVLDAQRLSAGPIARVHIPRRVPFGFHGDWVPAAG